MEGRHQIFLIFSNVAFARLFFPMEANLAMERANVETTHEFVGLSACKGSGTGLREISSWRMAYPIWFTPKGHSRRAANKKMQFKQLREDVQRAFNKDKAVHNSSGCPPISGIVKWRITGSSPPLCDKLLYCRMHHARSPMFPTDLGLNYKVTEIIRGSGWVKPLNLGRTITPTQIS
ncbi:hypothetical protein Nepgr_032865 [Nepenthes gracilis]|uniref:NPR1/NIM1-like C-terminal domain-containing protein n=1 Tax=Nepenthes gracilis TaxID=150966 RepID=A0AAD3TLM9_NEPGR|nr:hypothetical protein Nepgr_032865 [Nepenthes gracilis]